MEEEWIPIIGQLVELLWWYLVVFAILVLSRFFKPIVDYFKDIKVAKIRANNPEPEQIITYLMEPNKVETKSFFTSLKEKWKRRKESDGGLGKNQL